MTEDRRQLTFAAIGAVVLTLVFFMFAVKPKLTQISETKIKLEAAQEDERDLSAKLTELRAIQRGSIDLANKLQAVAGYLPSTPALPDFIRLVQSAATKAGVDLRSIAPSPPVARTSSTGIDEITVTLTALGGFHRVEDFLARLERLPRIVLVTALALNPTTDELSGLTVLSTTITLKMFVAQSNAHVGSVAKASPSPAASGGANP